MKTRIAITLAVAGFALLPVAAHAADRPSDRTPIPKVQEVMDDGTITTKIKAEFAKDKGVSAAGISVDTKNGVVTLSGNARNKEEADKAVAIAKNAGGVKSVKNDIRIGGSR